MDSDKNRYLFEVVDLLDVAALGRLQLADVPVLISALLEESGRANLVAARQQRQTTHWYPTTAQLLYCLFL